MYTEQQIVKALEAYTSVLGIEFDIVKFVEILKKVSARQVAIENDPMEANLCDSCQ